MGIRVNSKAAVLFGCAALLLSQHAQAGGFYSSEIGSPGSLGTAGAANPTNTVTADAAWTNPAGMTGLKEDQLLAGMQIIVPSNRFDSSAGPPGSDGGNSGIVSVVPSFFTVKKLFVSECFCESHNVIVPSVKYHCRLQTMSQKKYSYIQL